MRNRKKNENEAKNKLNFSLMNEVCIVYTTRYANLNII